jgi:hypothetical protein
MPPKRKPGRPRKTPSTSDLQHQRYFFKWMICMEKLEATQRRLRLVEHRLRKEIELNKTSTLY